MTPKNTPNALAKLDWYARGPDDEPYWELVLTAGNYLTVFGRLYIAQDGYVALTVGPGRASAYPLPGLSLDEAKSAAKLLLMTGKEQ